MACHTVLVRKGGRLLTDLNNPKVSDDSNVQKNEEDWVTGNEPMTGAQASYLKTLSEEAGEEFNGNLTKMEASKRIEELQNKTGRGQT